jgi:aminopeptidase N
VIASRRAPAAVLLSVIAACAVREPSPAPAAATAAPASAPTAAIRHALHVTLVPARHAVLVEDQVTLSPELRARLGDRVVFTLHAGLAPERADAGPPLAPSPSGPALHEDSDAAGPAPVPVEHFAVTLAPGARSFTVRYGGEVFHPPEGGGPEHARSMSESPGLVSPEGVLLSGATRWVPELTDDLLAFTLDVRVPPGWDAISQGHRAAHERDAEGTRVRWDSPEPQQEVLLVAGAWTEHGRDAAPVSLHVFLREDDPALAERYLAGGGG